MSTTISSIGPYRVIKALGEGNFGQVYQCQNPHGQQFAVKIFKDIASDKELKKSFLLETSSLLQLDNEYIVKYEDFGECEYGLYVVIELCSKGSLLERFNSKGSQSEEEISIIGMSMCHALKELDKRQLVHRDIKPDNILISNNGNLKLTDMGLAQNMNSTVEGVYGTANYISPEQCTNDGEMDWRSDQYSLGATLFHLLTGQAPYHHKIIQKILEAHVNDDVVDPRSIIKCSDAIAAILMKMMNKNPKRRYQDPEILISDFQYICDGHHCVKQLPSRLRSAKKKRKKTSRLTVSEETPSRHKKKQSEKKSSVKPLIITVSAVLACLLILSLIIMNNSTGTPQSPEETQSANIENSNELLPKDKDETVTLLATNNTTAKTTPPKIDPAINNSGDTLKQGLKLHWSFDDLSNSRGVKDDSRNGHKGRMHGASSRAPGIFGQAMKFDGIDDYVICKIESTTYKNYSISMWVKAVKNQREFSALFCNSTSKKYNFQIDVTGRRYDCFRWWSMGHSRGINMGGVVNEWIHLALTCDSDKNIRVFYNGEERQIKEVTRRNTGNVFDEFTIGTGRNRTQYFKGLIDEFRVYERVLKAEEVKQLAKRP